MDAYVRSLKARLAWRDNPYFVALRDGSLSREDFVETQLQFAHAVFFFSRPMMALAARMPAPAARLPLLENVHDEHGRGLLESSHEATFTRFLEKLGVARNELKTRRPGPEVRAFNTVLIGACTLDDVPTALAMLGIIEDLFSGISAELGRGVVARGWPTADALVHYSTHEELDVHHAEGFYAPLRARFATEPAFREQVEQGLELGASVFLTLYRGLLESRRTPLPAKRAKRGEVG